ncbi:MAG TPA: TcmI family type II polyketide cyclase [Rugosimonospora sp.]|nr:TcmI family type II polyketide cyclase [Rugosimonospora sp.]
MKRTLVVRIDPAAGAVGDVVVRSDPTDLPHLMRASSRALFTFHDLYLHLVQRRDDSDADVEAARTNPLFVQVNSELSRHAKAYDPASSGPRDAMAPQFHEWHAA